jgi:hypothetical protein
MSAYDRKKLSRKKLIAKQSKEKKLRSETNREAQAEGDEQS